MSVGKKILLGKWSEHICFVYVVFGDGLFPVFA